MIRCEWNRRDHEQADGAAGNAEKLMTLRMKHAVAGFLVDNLLGRAAIRQRKYLRGIDPQVRDQLARTVWQGDVEALQDEIERIVALARDGDFVTSAHWIAAFW